VTNKKMKVKKKKLVESTAFEPRFNYDQTNQQIVWFSIQPVEQSRPA